MENCKILLPKKYVEMLDMSSSYNIPQLAMIKTEARRTGSWLCFMLSTNRRGNNDANTNDDSRRYYSRSNVFILAYLL